MPTRRTAAIAGHPTAAWQALRCAAVRRWGLWERYSPSIVHARWGTPRNSRRVKRPENGWKNETSARVSYVKFWIQLNLWNRDRDPIHYAEYEGGWMGEIYLKPRSMYPGQGNDVTVPNAQNLIFKKKSCLKTNLSSLITTAAIVFSMLLKIELEL